MPKRRSISFKQLKESMPLKEERQNDEEATVSYCPVYE